MDRREFLQNAAGIAGAGATCLGGQASDIDIHAKEILRMREMLNEIMAKHTGQSLQRIQDDTDRDYIMGAGQAKEYGIIDDVLSRRA